jgi:gluconate 5-dehydrogenase
VGVHGTSKEKMAGVGNKGAKFVPLVRRLETVEDCRGLIEEAQRGLQRIDILINCVGTNRRKPIRDVAAEDFEQIVAVNLQSVFFTCQAVHPIMQRQGGGKIINVGSVTSTDGLGGVSVYGATKAAIAQLTKTMALEWAKDNIQVNCLAPGFIMTPLTEQGLWGDAHRKQWLLDRIPARRPGKPEELLGVALLLASDASSYITGQIINVDGGYLAGGSWLRDDE